MNRVQKKALKGRMRQNWKIRKEELKKLVGASSRFHFHRDRCFKMAVSNLRKEIRLYQRLGKKI